MFFLTVIPERAPKHITSPTGHEIWRCRCCSYYIKPNIITVPYTEGWTVWYQSGTSHWVTVTVTTGEETKPQSVMLIYFPARQSHSIQLKSPVSLYLATPEHVKAHGCGPVTPSGVLRIFSSLRVGMANITVNKQPSSFIFKIARNVSTISCRYLILYFIYNMCQKS